MTIQELYNKRTKTWEGAKAFLDSKRNDKGLLSAEDTATYEQMENDVVALGKEIERMERMERIDNALSQPTSSPIVTAPSIADTAKTGRGSKEYREDFICAMRKHPLVHNVLSTTPGADGGYLVPEEFESQLVQKLEEENIVRNLAKIITTNAAYTESNPTFTQTTIDAYKLTDLIRVSEELIQDSAFDIESYLMSEIARAFGMAEEQAFCVGTGSGQPTGIFTANGGNVGVTAASATAITADEILSLVYALKSPYRKNASFLMNDATVAALRKLKDNNGVYLWQPALSAGEPDKLLGYDLYTSSYVPTAAADAFAVAFGDFTNYWIADRAGRSVKRLSELYATNGQVGFVASERVDGKVIVNEGIQLLQMKKSS